eukprot:TRINITY_DN867_c0_g1_i1.p1 TRINITY_DN867_c0_g1~~TRINITY_DN867_c0_g1_i1.p1  ORF type:complete len:748 (-),score=158.97 TRINITY_DN867_c0_g1_i1:132-2375(-)
MKPCFTTVAHSARPERAATPRHWHLQASPLKAQAPVSEPRRHIEASLVIALVGAARAAHRERQTSRRCSVLRRRSSSADAVWPLPEEDKTTLKQVIIVHRHGTRFPTKPTGAGNLSWPQRAQFWESYKGHLTPVGAKTLMDTGAVLRKRYMGGESCLFKGYEKVDGRAIAVYTSNVQRTLQSAWSFLLGLVPDASIFFAFRSERVFAQAVKQSVGVPIYVEDATEGDDRLFHEWKIGDAYKKWQKENQQRSEFFNYAKSAPEYLELLDKLYEVTHEAKLAPGRDPLARLTAAKDVDTQVMIEEAHNRPVLPNEFGEALLPREQELLRRIGDEVKRCWFGDALGHYEKSYGRQGAGYLAHKIWRHMDERASGTCHQRFVQFSCHDTTMCALAAYYGIELTEIGFGSFFTLELHQTADGVHRVKFYYNSKPDEGDRSYQDLPSAVLPLGKEPLIKTLADCPPGTMLLSDFEEHSRIDGVEERFDALMKLLGRADLGPTRDDLRKLLEGGKHGWLSFEDWKERYHERFLQHDDNGDARWSKAEMQAALMDWYGIDIKGRTTDLVFHMVDREPEEDVLTEEEVYLIMCTLIGVRGSISSKSEGQQMAASTMNEDVNASTTSGTTRLMNAADAGDVELAKELLSRGAKVNMQDRYGWTALRYAVRKKNTTMVNLLIDGGADVNLASLSGRTPLMSAVSNRAPNVVQLLVEAGAELHATNEQGMTAFDIASRGGGMGSSVIRTLTNPKLTVSA